LHRPYFAMMKSSRKGWTLNPYTKKGVDAMPENAQTIAFDKFLALFEI